ncbi:MAG: right-handed parallel beta-helix repeat-containing protein [Planctomycetota bacterium]|jgi:hypothetical protein
MMNTSHTLLVYPLLFLGLSLAGFGATLEVPAQYPTIQAAIDAAEDGDTVLVSPGTYVENIDFIGKAIIVTSSDGPWSTVIDGSQARRVAVFLNDEGQDSVLKGFLINNGLGGIQCKYASPTLTCNVIAKNGHGGTGHGAGIYCEHASPDIGHNLITGNKTFSYGGGIACQYDSDASIHDNIITNNHAGYYGGGININLCSPSVINNVISDNFIDEREGGGIYCIHSESVIMDNTITGNLADVGGGIHCGFNSSPFIANNIIAGNQVDLYGWGGGVCCWQNSSTVHFVNNTVTANSAKGVYGQGGGLFCYQANMSITNSIFWDNHAYIGQEIFITDSTSHPTHVEIGYCDLDGGKLATYTAPGSTMAWGPGMIDTDPLFVDEAKGDFHLRYSSPCRDMGDNSAPGLPGVDFEGDPRIAYGNVDMGADEFYTHLYYTGVVKPGKVFEGKFVGLPGSTPVNLWFALSVLDPPFPTPYGLWYLEPPLTGPIFMGTIPADGVLVVPARVPNAPPAPYDVPMQALIGNELTNLSVLKVR